MVKVRIIIYSTEINLKKKKKKIAIFLLKKYIQTNNFPKITPLTAGIKNFLIFSIPHRLKSTPDETESLL